MNNYKPAYTEYMHGLNEFQKLSVSDRIVLQSNLNRLRNNWLYAVRAEIPDSCELTPYITTVSL